MGLALSTILFINVVQVPVMGGGVQGIYIDIYIMRYQVPGMRYTDIYIFLESKKF